MISTELLVSECDFPFVSDGVYVDYCVVDPMDDYCCPTAWNVANSSLMRKRNRNHNS